MKVVIFGATGYSGKYVLAEALKQQHQVTILVRNAAKVTEKSEYLTIVEGNVLDPDAVRSVLVGQDAVLQCLGLGGKGDGKPTTFNSQATQIICEAMHDTGVNRLVCMSNTGTGDSKTYNPWIFRAIVVPYFMKWLQEIMIDKERVEQIIRKSKLLWTIVRCPRITEKPAKGTIKATVNGKGLKLEITLGDLAVFMVEQLHSKTFVHFSPSISN